MRNDSDKKASLILALCGIVPVVWFALLTAPYVSGGLVEIVRNLPQAMNTPFSITVCADSLKTVLIFLLAYGMGIGIYLSTRRNYRRREEHGSAKWGDAKAVNKKYRATKPEDNKLFTKNVRMGLDGRKHRRKRKRRLTKRHVTETIVSLIIGLTLFFVITGVLFRLIFYWA